MRRVLIAVALLSLPARVLGADPVTLEDVKTEWQNLYGAIVYAASATVKNSGASPVRAVKVRLELFDKDGRPVAQRDGYNLAAEVLAERPAALDAVKPILPGGTDNLRLWVDKSDIPRPFRTSKLTIVEVR